MVDFAKYRNRPAPPAPLVPDLVVAVTGHRPPKIGGYDRDNPLRRRLRDDMRATMERLRQAAEPRRDDFRALHLDSYLRQVEWKTPTSRPVTGVLGLSGVALGVDQDFCGVLARLSPPVPYVAVVPFPGQEERWPKDKQRIYAAVLDHAVGVVYVSKQPPRDDEEARQMLLARNEWLCCCADELIAVWDGSAGGTGSCVSKWRRLNHRSPIIIDPKERT